VYNLVTSFRLARSAFLTPTHVSYCNVHRLHLRYKFNSLCVRLWQA